MTEAEWLARTNQHELLVHIRPHASDRKLRLVGCATVRREWKYLIRKRSRRAVETAERYADGRATAEEVAAAYSAAMDIVVNRGERYDTLREANITYALQNAAQVAHPDVWWASDGVGSPACSPTECDLIRDIFGNPFRPVAVKASWRTETVIGLASAIYESRNFGQLPLLADALEDAGCRNADLLGHCRSPGPHVLGCWAVDAVLGKE